MSVNTAKVEAVVQIEPLSMGSSGTHRAVVRWSDGTESEALRWYADEIDVLERELIGKTEAELRSLHFRKDRNFLLSD